MHADCRRRACQRNFECAGSSALLIKVSASRSRFGTCCCLMYRRRCLPRPLRRPCCNLAAAAASRLLYRCPKLVHQLPAGGQHCRTVVGVGRQQPPRDCRWSGGWKHSMMFGKGRSGRTASLSAHHQQHAIGFGSRWRGGFTFGTPPAAATAAAAPAAAAARSTQCDATHHHLHTCRQRECRPISLKVVVLWNVIWQLPAQQRGQHPHPGACCRWAAVPAAT